ncbi:hypothetical protein AGR56_09210 [Clostridium sp. DMHC 10]|uniref:hypothetical protein n=1 Tax=Clostridium sp. DMHC 10 TaxID=747377 RepID=UPI00069F0CD1|nr:hypothetical protein [Clostridium sp. DMHC 10]KOF56825.1 hypothetical protein AGR56_09210 [Clostridium sp. DMHC 10]
MTKKEIMTDNLKDLTKEKSFNNILCEGLKLLKPSRSRIIFMLIILVIIIFPVFNIAFKKNTLEEFLSIIELSNDVIKDLFGIIFTGYALFQALVGANLLKQNVN